MQHFKFLVKIHRLPFILIMLAVFVMAFNFVAFAQDETESTEGARSVREAIRKRVEDKLRQLSKNPRAIVGELKEMTDTTLNITTKTGEAFAATSDETKYFKVNKGKQTSIKFEDLILGNFTIVMGYQNGDNVLDAKRVISYDNNPVTARKAIFGFVKTNTDGDLTVQTLSQENLWTIQTNNKTQITMKNSSETDDVTLENIETNTKVIVAGVLNAKKVSTIVADTIYIISGKTTDQGVSGSDNLNLNTTPTPTKLIVPSPTKR